MKKFLSLFLTVIVTVSGFILNVSNSTIAITEKSLISSFINDTIEMIQKSNKNKNFTTDNGSDISTFSTSSTETANIDFQTCRLIIKSDKEIEKLNSVGIASGFLDYYIVQFENQTETQSAFEYYSECDYIEAIFPDRVFNALSDYTVDENNYITYMGTPKTLESWGSETAGSYDLVNYIISKSNNSNFDEIRVAVIDSGIDLNHPFLKNRIVETGYNISGNGTEGSEHDVICGHGTSVASVIVDNTPDNVKIESYRVVDDSNYTTSASVLTTLLETFTDKDELNKPQIINISLNYYYNSKAEKKLFDDAISAANDDGIMVVVSSGNNNIDIDYNNNIPASCEAAITVAASGSQHYPTSWSSRGDSVDIMAPGENIPVAIPDNKYKLQSGTSFSAPLITAVIASLKTLYPEETQKQLEVRIESSAIECDFIGVVNMYGYGIVDAIGAAGLKRAEKPEIIKTDEVYTNKAEIEITVPENSTVYYTMDQTYPSKENGVLYTKPIVIEDDVFQIHAVAYSTNLFRSEFESEKIKVSTLCTDDVFEIDDNGIITAYYGDVNYLKIPNYINDIKVTGFADSLFSDSDFFGVYFSDEIETINSNLFYNNSNIQFADGLGITEIQSGAFSNCQKLYEVNFDNVETIGKEAFKNTRQLSGIYFPECTHIDQYAFYNSVIRYVELESVEVICAYAFEECDCLYKFYTPNLIEFRERDYDGENWYGGSRLFQKAQINCVIDLKNITELPYGCFYQSEVERIEFSNVKVIDTLPITYCKKPWFGTITVVLPSTLEICDIDTIPWYDAEDGISYEINYNVYGTKGTYAEQWATSNGYNFIEISQDTAVINDLPCEYYSYMQTLEADVVGFNRKYQWYGANKPIYDKGIRISGADDKEFNPNEYKQYKYYYCIVTSQDVGYEPIEIRTSIVENKTYYYTPEKSNGKVTIAAPSTRYIKYGESVKLYANATGLPEGAKIKWRIVDGSGVSLDVSATGKICTVTSKSNGDVVIEAYAVNSNGNVLVNESGNRICAREGVGSEVNLWLIIVYYIKQLFSVTKTAINMLL